MYNSEYRYIKGLHRPFNVSLKQLSWVCLFLYRFFGRRKYPPSSLSVSFWLFMIDETIRRGEDKKHDLQGTISFQTAKILKDEWLFGKSYELIVKQITTLTGSDYQGREGGTNKNAYSTFKNASYYLTFAKKLGFVDCEALTSVGLELVNAYHNFYLLNNKEKHLIFAQILKYDGDYFLPFLIAKRIAKKSLAKTESTLHLIYLKSVKNKNFFNFVNSSMESNYDKVRDKWVEQLGLIDKYGRIRKEFHSEIMKSTYSDDFIKTQNDEESFLISYISKKKKNEKNYNTLEKRYEELVKQGKHDLGNVNLYDLKPVFQMTANAFSKMIESYIDDNRERIIVILSNTVASADSRKRFYIKNNPVLRIRLIRVSHGRI